MTTGMVRQEPHSGRNGHGFSGACVGVVLAAILASLSGSGPASASEGGWRVSAQRGSVSATARNGSGSAQFTLDCAGPAGSRFVSLSMQGVPRGWRAGALGDFATATIGEARFELVFEGSHDWSHVSERGGQGRISERMLEALGRGRTLVLTGRHVAASAERERTFRLGGGAALARVRQACR